MQIALRILSVLCGRRLRSSRKGTICEGELKEGLRSAKENFARRKPRRNSRITRKKEDLENKLKSEVECAEELEKELNKTEQRAKACADQIEEMEDTLRDLERRLAVETEGKENLAEKVGKDENKVKCLHQVVLQRDSYDVVPKDAGADFLDKSCKMTDE